MDKQISKSQLRHERNIKLLKWGGGALVAVLGVFLCKCIGLSGPAILVGALAGVAAGMVVSRKEAAHVME